MRAKGWHPAWQSAQEWLKSEFEARELLNRSAAFQAGCRGFESRLPLHLAWKSAKYGGFFHVQTLWPKAGCRKFQANPIQKLKNDNLPAKIISLEKCHLLAWEVIQKSWGKYSGNVVLNSYYEMGDFSRWSHNSMGFDLKLNNSKHLA